jgi:hypothetical protein
MANAARIIGSVQPRLGASISAQTIDARPAIDNPAPT